MNKNEYEMWVSRNVGKGGKRSSIDLYNKGKKGKERNPAAEEYPCKGVAEYHHYYERNSQKRDDDDKKKQQESSQSQPQSKNARKNDRRRNGNKNLTRSVVKQIASKVALVVVGSIVIVTAYQAIASKNAIPVSAVVASSSWTWENDHSGASVELFDGKGELIALVPGTVLTTTVDPTCVEEGTKTFTATAVYLDVSYSDVYEESLPALGHDFLEPVRTDHEDHYDLDYECGRCHEHFVISVDIDEKDTSALVCSWAWSEDYSNATLTLYDQEGSIVADSISATIASTETPATCTLEGAWTYLASATYEEKIYSDRRLVSIPALGHQFGEGVRTDYEDHYEMDYECERCHDHFVVSISFGEE